MSTPRVKGIFKGFDNEKEPEMQIGLPTDVKHVAHIGWDGPSVNTPSWMNEFKSQSSHSSAPSSLSRSVKMTEPDSLSASSKERDLPDLPKSSRRQLTGSAADSPTLDQDQGSESPGIPKKSRRKKSKDSGGGPSSRLKASHLDPNSGFGSQEDPFPSQQGSRWTGRNGSSEEFL